MKNQWILSPFFIGEPFPRLEVLAGFDVSLNRPALVTGTPQERMSAVYEPLAELVAETIRFGKRPVSIAGDCCSALGVLSGLQRSGLEPTLLWFDARGDLNTRQTTTSGFLGGMPLAMLVGRGEQTVVRGVGLDPLPESRVILTDARDLDSGERDLLARSSVRHVRDVLDLLKQPLPDGPLYVHFDTDIVDPKDVPAQNFLAVGGPSAADLGRVFRFLAQTGRVVAASMSSWNPDLDRDGRSQRICMDLFETLTAQ